MSVSEWLQAGIAAAKAGDTESAEAYLIAVVEKDESQVEAWLWLSRLIDDPAEKEVCLENVLALQPNNAYAKTTLLKLKTRPPAPPAEEASAAETEAPAKPNTPTDDFENPLACPYCGVVTPEDKAACINCGRALVWRKRVAEERSVWLWRGFFIQLYLLIISAGLSLGYLVFMGRWNNIQNAMQVLPAYVGVAVDFSPAEVEILFSVFPPVVFWLVASIVSLSLIVMLTLYLRLPNGHFIYLLNAALSAMVALVALLAIPVFPIKIAVTAFWAAAGLLQMLTALNLWDDFTFESGRIYMKVDQDALNTTTLRISARQYGERGLWAKAILHWRRALLRNPGNIDIHLELIEAYLHVGREDLARHALQEAQNLKPDHPYIKQLTKRLA